MKREPRVCIVIPAHNESSVIGDVIASIKKLLSHEHLSGDVVVVNDSSTDATSEVAAQAGAKVIDHLLNCGAGGATATGLYYASQRGYTIAATMDADGQHMPEDVINGIRLVMQDKVDLLIGSRLINATGMPALKQLGNWGISVLTYIMFGVKSTDSQSGLRIFSRQSLENLRWKTAGYEFASEMLWRARQAGLTVDEYPIQAIYTDYSKAKGQNNWNGVNILKALIRQRLTEFFE